MCEPSGESLGTPSRLYVDDNREATPPSAEAIQMFVSLTKAILPLAIVGNL